MAGREYDQVQGLNHEYDGVDNKSYVFRLWLHFTSKEIRLRMGVA